MEIYKYFLSRPATMIIFVIPNDALYNQMGLEIGIFFGILCVFPSYILRKISVVQHALCKSHPDLPTLSLRQQYYDCNLTYMLIPVSIPNLSGSE